MAARTQIHEFKGIFLASPTSYDTEISASSGVSAIVPGANELLEVWEVNVDGRASNSGTAGLELRDGNESSPLIRFIEVAAGESKIITFGGLPKKFSNSVWFQTIGEGVRVAVHYVPRFDRNA